MLGALAIVAQGRARPSIAQNFLFPTHPTLNCRYMSARVGEFTPGSALRSGGRGARCATLPDAVGGPVCPALRSGTSL